MTADGGADSFWRFSLMVYSRRGVAEALIGLQDRAGHNVNMILYGIWLALCESSALDEVGLARAVAATAGLDRGVVQPLRALRRALAAEAEDDVRELRRRVLALEIAAERRLQQRLARSGAGRRIAGAERVALADANLRLILGGDFASEEAGVLRRAIAA